MKEKAPREGIRHREYQIPLGKLKQTDMVGTVFLKNPFGCYVEGRFLCQGKKQGETSEEADPGERGQCHGPWS